MDEDAKRALKMAQDKYGMSVKVLSIGENDKYKLITLNNPNSDDAQDDISLIINKNTGQEIFGDGMIFDPVNGFEDFTYDLNYIYI